MTSPEDADLPAPQQLAVAWTPASLQPTIGALLSFDTHLGRLVSGASEPALGQLRLAWWREELGRPVESRARGNPVLEALGRGFAGEEAALCAVVDGWEHLLREPPLSNTAMESFAIGRAAGFAAFARKAGRSETVAAAMIAGQNWALADLVSRMSDSRERDRCRALFRTLGKSEPERLPRELRGLAVLDGLARRAMARDEPLLSGRGGALAALRLGMFGR